MLQILPIRDVSLSSTLYTWHGGSLSGLFFAMVIYRNPGGTPACIYMAS